MPEPAKGVLRTLAAHNVLGGYDLSQDYPELGNALLVCATEMRTSADMDKYVNKLEQVFASRRQGACATVVKFD